MNPWNNLWEFNTKRFSVHLSCQYDNDVDLSFDDTGETAAKIESGEWTPYVFRVTVRLDGRKVSDDYLGGSIYADPMEFVTSHRTSKPESRNTLANKARNVAVCHYFPDMVKQAINEARKALADVPSLRRVA